MVYFSELSYTVEPHFTVTSLIWSLFLTAQQNGRDPRWYGHLVITANFFWPVGDRINGVPLMQPLKDD